MYSQLQPDKSSRSYAITVNTYQGLFRFTCLPFGVSSAPAIFQLNMNNLYVLGGLTLVAVYFDIMICGRSRREHLVNLHVDEVLRKLPDTENV